MAYEENLKNISYDSDASIAGYTGPPGVPGSASPNYGKQYRAVRISGKSTVGLASSGRVLTTDGVTTSGSPNVSSASGAFTQADQGRPISGTGIPAGTRIKTVSSATALILTANSSATATGIAFTLGDLTVDGVLQNKPQQAGAAATVGVSGVTMAMAGAAITPEQECVPDSTGRFVPGSSSGTSGLKFKAVTAASGANELVSLAIS